MIVLKCPECGQIQMVCEGKCSKEVVCPNCKSSVRVFERNIECYAEELTRAKRIQALMTLKALLLFFLFAQWLVLLSGLIVLAADVFSLRENLFALVGYGLFCVYEGCVIAALIIGRRLVSDAITRNIVRNEMPDEARECETE